MKSLVLAAATALLVSPLIAGAALAHPNHSTSVEAGDLTITDAHARIIMPSRPAAAYFLIENDGPADRLIRAETPAFGRVELHTHTMEDGMMRMIEVEAIEVPEEGGAALQSGGDHVMLFDMQTRLKIGDEFPLTLIFERAGAVEVTARVLPIGESGAPGAKSGGGASDGAAHNHDQDHSHTH